ncbi:SCO family protein [Myroides indicus]|uniref:Protein SCO1/2 n=1 Tax=Myroides indicus TaxID=1323422 RepID=A0A4R7EYE8_9FLAO|nr:SCO family protein [Myroides indicus]TDS58823.1 protein SCO1/2 [Myroides indicus]
MKKFILMIPIFSAIFFIGCKNKENNNQPLTVETKTETTETKAISDLSIYNLPSVWTNQEGQDIELKELNGNVLVMVMIYTSCKAACPRLVADMRNIEKQVAASGKAPIKYILVSIDPETDTPERLKAFAQENQMNGNQWIFLRSTNENTREFAAILAVNYKRISPLDFSHSNIISVFNTQGELTYQQEGLGIDYAPTVAKIKEELAKAH